jgi:hypothetical protein
MRVILILSLCERLTVKRVRVTSSFTWVTSWLTLAHNTGNHNEQDENVSVCPKLGIFE